MVEESGNPADGAAGPASGGAAAGAAAPATAIGAGAGGSSTTTATGTTPPPPQPQPGSTRVDLELALDAAARVNVQLNREMEAVLLSLRQAEDERSAWEERARWLARKLADERRRHRRREGGEGDQGDGDANAVLREAIQEQQQQHQKQPTGTATTDSSNFSPQQQELAREAWEACAPQRRALEAAGRAAGWLARRGEISLGDRLGEGAFGVTYRCVWRGADAVAKHLRPPTTAAEALNFLREVRCLAAVRHPHVVPFLGAVLEEGACELWLLSECMPGGNMADWLRGRRPARSSQEQQQGAPPPPYTRPPPLAERLSAALDVARGLAALACAAPAPIMHRDVKPSNVFIDAGGRARLGDFGLARPSPGFGGADGGAGATEHGSGGNGGGDNTAPSSSPADLTGETGTYAYMAPEVVRHEHYDGQKADAWSFGVLLVEAATLERPYEHSRLTPVQIALGVADEKLKPWIPSALLPPAVAVLAGALCDFDPAMRPDWGFVVAELEQAVRELREGKAGKGGVQQQQSTSSWLLSQLLGAAGVPASWIPVLGAAAVAAEAPGAVAGAGGASASASGARPPA